MAEGGDVNPPEADPALLASSHLSGGGLQGLLKMDLMDPVESILFLAFKSPPTSAVCFSNESSHLPPAFKAIALLTAIFFCPSPAVAALEASIYC